MSTASATATSKANTNRLSVDEILRADEREISAFERAYTCAVRQLQSNVMVTAGFQA